MVEKLLTIVPRYGLANRMRALASGLILGEALQYKSCFYWEENELCNCSFTKLFDSDLTEVGRPLMETTEDQIFFSKEEMMGGIIEIGDEEKDKCLIVESFNPVMLEGTDREDFQRLFSNKLKEVFSPSPEVKSKFVDLPENCTGVHVRRTDNVSSRRESTDEAFFVSMDKVLEEDSETKFYLATDSPEGKESMILKYGNSKIITREIDSRRSRDTGIIDALVDIFMLSKTNKILGSYGSSFSAISGSLGGISQFPVIDQEARNRRDGEKKEIDRILEIALSQLERSEFDRAIENLLIIKNSFPYFFTVNLHLGKAYEGKGMYEEARECLEKYMSDYPFKEVPMGILERINIGLGIGQN